MINSIKTYSNSHNLYKNSVLSIKVAEKRDYERSVGLSGVDIGRSLLAQRVSFCAKNYLQERKKAGPNFNTSIMFRKFDEDDIKLFASCFKKLSAQGENPKMLVVGVADGQEPLTYLSIISELYDHKPLKECVDLNCVDLKPKFGKKKIDSTLSIFNFRPQDLPVGKTSFTEVEKDFLYEVNEPIVDYLADVFADSEKTKWNCDVVDFVKEADQRYDIISYNFVNMYLKEDEKQPTFNNLVKLLKSGGILIAKDCVQERINKLNSKGIILEEIQPRSGIWCKVSDD